MILRGTIVADNIAAGTISGDKIAANAITADKVNAGAITSDKITANVAINAPTITGGTLNGANLNVGSTFSVNGSSGHLIARSADITGHINASSGTFAGNLTGVTINAGTELTAASGKFRVDGNGLLIATGANIQGTINAIDGTFNGTVHIKGNSTIDGTVTGGNIVGTTIKGGEIKIGELATEVYNFYVDKDGNLTANNGTFGGTVKADKILGDVMLATTIPLQNVTCNTQNPGPVKIVTITVTPESFSRDVVVDGFTHYIAPQSEVFLNVYSGSTPGGIPDSSQRLTNNILSNSTLYGNPTLLTSRKIVRYIPAGQGVTFTIAYDGRSVNPPYTVNCKTYEYETTVTLYRHKSGVITTS